LRKLKNAFYFAQIAIVKLKMESWY